MKIRPGFVSNSSTTSFCIYGALIDVEDIKQFITGENLEGVDFTKEDWSWEVDWCDVETEICEKIGKEFSFYYEGECLEDFFIGRKLKTIGDDETGRQFKDSVEKKIKELFGDDYECRIIDETVTS